MWWLRADAVFGKLGWGQPAQSWIFGYGGWASLGVGGRFWFLAALSGKQRTVAKSRGSDPRATASRTDYLTSPKFKLSHLEHKKRQQLLPPQADIQVRWVDSLVHKYLLITYSVPDTLPSAGDTTVTKKAKYHPSSVLYSNGRSRQESREIIHIDHVKSCEEKINKERKIWSNRMVDCPERTSLRRWLLSKD